MTVSLYRPRRETLKARQKGFPDPAMAGGGQFSSGNDRGVQSRSKKENREANDKQ